MNTGITTKLSSRQALRVRYLPAAAALPETLLVKLQPFQLLLQPFQLSSGVGQQIWVRLHSQMHCEKPGAAADWPADLCHLHGTSRLAKQRIKRWISYRQRDADELTSILDWGSLSRFSLSIILCAFLMACKI